MTLLKRYASVILDASIDKALDYAISDPLIGIVCKGMRVEVPLRGRIVRGYVLELKEKPDFTPVKSIIATVSSTELITEDLFDLALWMARYYCSPLRQVFKCMIPASLRGDVKEKEQLFVMRNKTREELLEHCKAIRNKNSAQASVLDVMLQVTKGILLSQLLEKTQGSKSPVDTLVKKGFLKVESMQIDRSPLVGEEYFPTKAKTLTDEQQLAFDKIADSIKSERFETHLVHGVTGSGKTEVYLQAIDKALAKGKSCIMLVPEIALTGQTIERFRSRFEGNIAILHCRLSQGERFDEWQKMRHGKAKIAIGARSCVFSPMPNLGLIIVDEEHESSYKKSEETPCYNARDVAVMRGKMTKSCVILGSATPSLESYYNAKNNKYTLSSLENRASSTMPSVKVIDMKKEYEKAQGFTNFSSELIDAIKKRQENGEQTIVFLNRRGYHTSMLCKTCGQTIQCVQCAVSLTFHKGENVLACHLCGHTLCPPPRLCPTCKSENPLKYKGVGTELIEKSLQALIPDVRTLRIDGDTTKHKGSHQKLLKDFGTGKADILIGTQMIAKGLHFPLVTLVAVLNSDSALNFPDFRASETTFQLITQVAGRSGRGSLPGEVIIQTCMPENATLQCAAKHDFHSFYAEEIATREIFNYPPFMQMAKLVFAGPDEKQTLASAEMVRSHLIKQLLPTFQAMPPVPAGYAKVKNLYRFQFLVRAPSILPVSRAVENIQNTVPLNRNVHMTVDINPSSTFF